MSAPCQNASQAISGYGCFGLLWFRGPVAPSPAFSHITLGLPLKLLKLAYGIDAESEISAMKVKI
jgi:hypothetical protein